MQDFRSILLASAFFVHTALFAQNTQDEATYATVNGLQVSYGLILDEVEPRFKNADEIEVVSVRPSRNDGTELGWLHFNTAVRVYYPTGSTPIYSCTFLIRSFDQYRAKTIVPVISCSPLQQPPNS